MDAIYPAATSAMVDTEPGKHALAYIMKSGTTELSPQEAVTVCDFLTAQILLGNGQRPGPLETAHLLDFKRVQAKEDCKHETSKADPAPLTISVNLTTNIETYIANRGILANEDEEVLFVTANGTPFNPGTIGK